MTAFPFGRQPPPGPPPYAAIDIVGGVGIISFGLAANLPAPSVESTGALYYATDTGVLYWSNGSLQVPITAPVTPALYDAFAGKSGAPVSADSGQTWYLTGSNAAAIAILNGLLTINNTSATTAAYEEVNMGATIKRIGAVIQFATSGTTEAGAANLISWADGTNIPYNSTCHLSITPTYWQYGIWSSAGSYTSIRQRYFDVPLPLGSPVTMEVIIDAPNGRATVIEPDGSAQLVSSPLLREGIANSWVAYEQYLSYSTDCIPGYAEIWCDV